MTGRKKTFAQRRRELVAEIAAMGWQIEFRPYLECAEMPGLLGHYAGVCMRNRKLIRVSTEYRPSQIVEIIEHEMRHARGADHAGDCVKLGLRCGGII